MRGTIKLSTTALQAISLGLVVLVVICGPVFVYALMSREGLRLDLLFHRPPWTPVLVVVGIAALLSLLHPSANEALTLSSAQEPPVKPPENLPSAGTADTGMSHADRLLPGPKETSSDTERLVPAKPLP